MKGIEELVPDIKKAAIVGIVLVVITLIFGVVVLVGILTWKGGGV